MSKMRQYFVAYAHRHGFGSIRVDVVGKLVISQLSDTIVEAAPQLQKLQKDQIIVLCIYELDPKKEVWK